MFQPTDDNGMAETSEPASIDATLFAGLLPQTQAMLDKVQSGPQPNELPDLAAMVNLACPSEMFPVDFVRANRAPNCGIAWPRAGNRHTHSPTARISAWQTKKTSSHFLSANCNKDSRHDEPATVPRGHLRRPTQRSSEFRPNYALNCAKKALRARHR